MAKAPGDPTPGGVGIVGANVVPVDTDEYYQALSGGFRAVSSDSITLASETYDQLFSSVPASVTIVEFSITGFALNLTFDTTEPTLTVGHYYPANKTYRISASAQGIGNILAFNTGGGQAKVFYTLYAAG